MERTYANYLRKNIFMLMTSLITSQHDDKVSLLYSCFNEISTLFMITQKLIKITPQNFTYVLSPWLRQQWRHSLIANLGKYAISDCIFICLSAGKIMHNSQMLWHIFTKLDTLMHLVLVQNCQTNRTNILVKMQILASPHLSECAFILDVCTNWWNICRARKSSPSSIINAFKILKNYVASSKKKKTALQWNL